MTAIRKFGLIGFPLSHSFSQNYFTEKFRREQISDCSYTAFPLPGIDALPAILADESLCGLNVTIPYKEQVLDYLDERDEVVRSVGACNCIKIARGGGGGGDRGGGVYDAGYRLHGYNTDVIGFERALVPKLRPHHDHALILGTGGAAKAVKYVLRRLGISYRFVSRDPGRADDRAHDRGDDRLSYREVDNALLSKYTLIINTTPMGMTPRVDEYPPLPYEAMGAGHYLFDLVYNPAKTLFLSKGEAQGAVIENGYEMLVIQAEESWSIWNA
jgi:shikimate dehydrogenase